jgi:C1A family cysteine protease
MLDYRQTGKVVTAVRDQALCGSCWAFSATESVEGQMGMNGQLTDLSAQNLVDCVSEDYGCDGGWPDDALAYVEKTGIETETSYPYTGVNQTCNASMSTKHTTIDFYVEISEGVDVQLQAALLGFGPVSVAIYVDDSFEAYTSGVYDSSSCPTGEPNHAMLLVGYHRDYWIVKNSWGGSWGEDGYVYMNRSRLNLCGIASHAVVPVIIPKSISSSIGRIARILHSVSYNTSITHQATIGTYLPDTSIPPDGQSRVRTCP